MTSSRILHRSLTLFLTVGLGWGSQAAAEDLAAINTSTVAGGTANQTSSAHIFDLTPPAIRLTSINLAHEIDHDAAAGMIAATLGAGGADVLITGHATDLESGVSSIELFGQLRVYCAPTTGVENLQRAELALTKLEVGIESGGAFPSQLSSTLLVPFTRATGLCAARGLRLVDVEAELYVDAINGAGTTVYTPVVRITRGPARLRVSVHNAFHPCLRELEDPFGTEHTYRNHCEGARLFPWDVLEDPPRRPTMTAVMDLWASEFATEDMTFVNELAEPRWASMLLQRMPGFVVAHHGTTAIFSRFPISDVRHDSVATAFSGQGILFTIVESEYVRATVIADGRPVVAYSVHWAHRPAGPESSSDNRLVMADRMVKDIATIDPHVPILVAGDFNAKSSFVAAGEFAEQGTREEHTQMIALHGGSMPEIAALEAALRLARREVWDTDKARYDLLFGRTPVEHLFLRGDYHAAAYSNGAVAFPSDHPRLAFELVKGN